MAGADKLRGLVAQSLNGRKSYADAFYVDLLALPVVATSGSAIVTAPDRCIAWILAQGPGGSGANDVSNGQAGGGGGGAALFHRVRLRKGDQIAYAIGAVGAGVPGDTNGSDATDTTITLPRGVVLTAGGGKGGKSITASGVATGGAGGVANGAAINRNGGDGGLHGVAGGGTGPYGGSGGAFSGTAGGGGGGAGFLDRGTDFIGGAGSAAVAGGSAAGGAPGGGSGASQTAGVGGAGAAGKVIVVLIKVR